MVLGALRDDLHTARPSGKSGLIVGFSTLGCSYCYKSAEETLRDPKAAACLRSHFDALSLAMFSDDDSGSRGNGELLELPGGWGDGYHWFGCASRVEPPGL